MLKKRKQTAKSKVCLTERIDALKAEIDRTTARKAEVAEQCRIKARRVEELTESADAVQAKRIQLQKKSMYLQEQISRFVKLGQKAKVNFRGSDLLRKEEAYVELAAGFEALTAQRY